jgi:para-aminobenzoate synthetase/4-amino-4-deoxychorismate lyase
VNKAVLIHDPSRGRWLAFDNPCRIYSTSNPAEVLPLLREMEAAVNEHKLHAAGFISYEAAPAFDPALTVLHDPSGFPLMWFGLYQEPTSWSPRAPAPLSTETPPPWVPSLSRDEYAQALGRIRQYLFNGETYQVNYTFRLTRPFKQDPLTLFENLIHAQGAHYSAFIDIGDFTICSASPELFFRLDGSHLESRPMKGTMKRGLTPQEDLLNARALQHSPKDQSENVMIVDMIRNDMGRVAEKGQVTVEKLFTVERYPTVWQMTSTVSASTQASLCEILTALFPCASITGAPKPRTMALIAREETAPRRIYTGAIGYLAPDRQAQFNVAIRTVLIDKTRHVAEYGVGGGIVWDSVSANEYEECWAKAKVLTESPEEFQLLETLLWTPDKGIFLLERHLKRLEESAEYFGFAVCIGKIRGELLALKLDGVNRIRILVSRSGALTLESGPFDPAAAKVPVRVRLAQRPIDISNRFLYHKTTCRQAYEDAKTNLGDCDDVLLWNPAGELTESTIANLVVELDGDLLTPPVECGLLAGTFRAELLLQGEIKEAVIRIEDLPRVRKVFLINSLRKWREAIVVR